MGSLRPFGRVALLVILAAFLAGVSAETLVRVAATFDARIRNLAAAPGRDDWLPMTAAEYVESRPDALTPHGEYFGYLRNRFGFNDREPEDEVASGAFRIVGLGDSFTFGIMAYPRAYLTTAEAVSTLFTRGEPPVAIYNLGVPAAGLADYRRVFRLFGRTLHPDLALVTIYLGNDILDFQGWNAPRGALGNGLRSWALAFLRRLWRIRTEVRIRPADVSVPPKENARGGAPSGVRPDFSPDGTFGREVFSDGAWDRIVDDELETFVVGPEQNQRMRLFLAELDRLLDDLGDAGVPMALVLAPSRLQVEHADLDAALERAGRAPAEIDLDLPARRISEWARERGVPLLGLTRVFRARAVDGSRYQPNDTHWNVSGNDLAGFEVGRWLARSKLISTSTSDTGRESPG